MAISIPSRLLFIDGEWREPAFKKRIPVINPATEEVIGDIPAATAEDVEIAVDAARRAFTRNKGKDWASASGAVRAKYLRAIAAKITQRKSELAKLESIDCGKPLEEAAWDMDDVAGCFEYFADLAEGLDAKQKAPVSLPMDSFKCYIRKEPIGVVGLITPWNYPLLMATWKVAPALAAGCTAILKPSELASVTCLELAEVCREVGLPPGVLNILSGLGPEAGAPLASHPNVDKIAFTGSTLTGSKIMTAAAQLVKPVTLELGGKSPIIVFEDVDLDKAVEWTMFGCFWTNGQICSAARSPACSCRVPPHPLLPQFLPSVAVAVAVSHPFLVLVVGVVTVGPKRLAVSLDAVCHLQSFSPPSVTLSLPRPWPWPSFSSSASSR